MAKFKIKKTVKSVFGTDSPKGVVFDGKTAITDDAAWCKELRKLAHGTCEELFDKVVEDGD